MEMRERKKNPGLSKKKTKKERAARLIAAQYVILIAQVVKMFGTNL